MNTYLYGKDARLVTASFPAFPMSLPRPSSTSFGGRVGRGEYQSCCILIHGTESKETMERLEILNQSNDGFFIAREDLRLRGTGDFFGIHQSGLMEFKMADVFNDAPVLMEANEAAAVFRENDVKMMLKKYRKLREKIRNYGGDICL